MENQLSSLNEYKEHSLKVLDENASSFFEGGCGREITLKNNEEAFYKIRIRPRVLVDVSQRNMTTTILGQEVSIPFGIAPTALQKMAHKDGESAAARAAGASNTIFTLSMIASSTIEEVAKNAPNAIKWLQTFIYKDRDVSLNLIKRAEKAGFKALVVTVDAPMLGLRNNFRKNKFSVPPHLSFAMFDHEEARNIHQKEGNRGVDIYVRSLFDTSLTWKDIKWLKDNTSLPIVLKGILTAEDAIKAADIGVAGILVSNHGARQLDGSPATIEALPEIVEAVGHKVEVYVDGGVRDGSDIYKALALGARMVFLGRPIIWGLAHSGEEGVKQVLNILRNELDNVMAISGSPSLDAITKCRVAYHTN